MAKRPPPLSLKLPSGRLAVLDRAWMAAYFSARIPRWYPGRTLRRLSVKDAGAYEFKKTLRFTLHLADRRGVVTTHILRGNIPSLDTTHEARVADAAMRILWRHHKRSKKLPLTRPLGYSTRLRLLLYEEAPGLPLLKLLRKHRKISLAWSRAAGRWLGSLHNLRLRGFREKSLAHERREAVYFRFNFYWAGKRRAARAGDLLARYLRERALLDPEIRRSRTLIHGDLNPANIIVDERRHAIQVIDFGNAWCADPMSDLANSLTQYALIRWTFRTSPALLERHARSFMRGYTSIRPLDRSSKRRLLLHTAWWSLQSLSYTLALAHFLAINLSRPRLEQMVDDLCDRAERALDALATHRHNRRR